MTDPHAGLLCTCSEVKLWQPANLSCMGYCCASCLRGTVALHAKE